MERHYDGNELLQDVTRALEEALGKHGLEFHSLLGMTTVLGAIAWPLKLHKLQGKAGQEMGRLGYLAYEASTIPRKVALLQSPFSLIVNTVMESIVVALTRAKIPLDDDALRLATYRVFLVKPRATISSAEKEEASLGPAFLSARDYLVEGRIISRSEQSLWRLNELWEMA